MKLKHGPRPDHAEPPVVLDEVKTIFKVLDGVSLGRYGDGEIKHMDGRRNVSQVFFPKLQTRLKEVFRCRDPRFLVGIPNVYNGRSFTEVDDNYIKNMRRRFGKIASPKQVYGSSYITRGDLCPYLSQMTYWSMISELWNGRDVVLVRGNFRRAAPDNMMIKARSLVHVEIPSSHAWGMYDEFMAECLTHPKESIYLLCAGPTATVMAHDLMLTGRWAVDIGHLGLFYKKLGAEFDYEPQIWTHRPTDPGYTGEKC